jgi:ABC-2 type transport system ATP-binding protein
MAVSFGNSPAIQVEHLVKRYGSVMAVNDISFDVRAGEIFGLLGPNGAGKTTTVECIEGLRQPDRGEIHLMGLDARRELGQIKERIGIQLQTTGFYPKLTVREVIDLFASFFQHRLSTDKLIDFTNLREKANARTKDLSGGQKQRLSVALALVNDPDLIFLDEPTTGLDPQARRKTWDVIEQLKTQGKTILMTTHYMEEAERLCKRVAIIDQGKIIAMDEPDALVRQHFQEQAIEFQSRLHPPESELKAIPGVARVQMEDGHITTYSTDVPNTMAGLLNLANQHTIEFGDLTVRRATLEDVFLKLTGRRIRE